MSKPTLELIDKLLIDYEVKRITFGQITSKCNFEEAKKARQALFDAIKAYGGE